jgi:hypothetical protein
MKPSSLTTRLGEYISRVLPDAHGHQRKAISDFVPALTLAQSCCQATPARFFDNFEAAGRRLSRLLHNARLDTEAPACAHARALVAQLPAVGAVRLALDSTTEESQHCSSLPCTSAGGPSPSTGALTMTRSCGGR